jgi:hypothetical protein
VSLGSALDAGAPPNVIHMIHTVTACLLSGENMRPLAEASLLYEGHTAIY